MLERKEGSFKSCIGSELFYQSWRPPGTGLGTLVVTHGMAEHSEAYTKFANGLAPHGWKIIAWDLQGHGRSEGKRGYIADFGHFFADLQLLIQQLQTNQAIEGPLALVGHSMGGLITLRYLLENQEGPSKAACLSSPQIGIALKVPAYKDFAARLLHRTLPAVTLFNEIRYSDLSRDPQVVKNYPLDPLRHDKISPTVYLGMLENIAIVKAQASKITLPLLMQLAGEDRIVSTPDAEALFEKLGSAKKHKIVYPQCYHEIFNDLDYSQVYADLHKFLKETLGV